MMQTTSDNGTLRLLVVSGSEASEKVVEFLKSWFDKGLIERLLVCDVTKCENLAGEAPLIQVRSTDRWSDEFDLINASARDAGLVAARGVLLYDHEGGADVEQYPLVVDALLRHLPSHEDIHLLRSGMVSVFAPYDSTTRFDRSAVNRETSAVVLSVEDRAQPNGGSGVLNSPAAYASHAAGAVATITGAWSGLAMPELGEFLSRTTDNDNFTLARALRHFVRVAGAAPPLTGVVDAAAEAMLGNETVELADTGVRKVRGAEAETLVNDAVTRVQELDKHPVSYDRPDTLDLETHLTSLPEQNRHAVGFGWHQSVEAFATMTLFARGVTRFVTSGKGRDDAPRGWFESANSLPRKREARLSEIVEDQKEATARVASERPRAAANDGMADALRDALYQEAFALVDGGSITPGADGEASANPDPQPVLAQRSLAAPHPQGAPQLSQDLSEGVMEGELLPAFDFWRRGGVLHRLEPFRNQRAPAIKVEGVEGVEQADEAQPGPAVLDVADDVALVPDELPDAEECSGRMYAWSEGMPTTVDGQAVEGLDVAADYHLAHSWYTSVRTSFLGKVSHHLGAEIDRAAEDHRDSATPPDPPVIASRLRRMRAAFQVSVWVVIFSAAIGTALMLVLAPSPATGLQRSWPWLTLLFVLLALVWLVAVFLYERKDRRILEEIETFYCDATNQEKLHTISRSEYERLLSVNGEFAPWAEILSWVINEPQLPVAPSNSEKVGQSPFSKGDERIALGHLPNAVRMARIELSDSFIIDEKRKAIEQATQRGWLQIAFEDVLAAAFPHDDWDFDEAVEKVAMGERGSVDARGVLLRKLRSKSLARQLRDALTDRVRQWRADLVPTLRGSELLEMQVVDLELGEPMPSRQGSKQTKQVAGKRVRVGRQDNTRRGPVAADTANLQAFQSPMIGGQRPFSTKMWTATRRAQGAHQGKDGGDVTGSLTSIAWALHGLTVEGDGYGPASGVAVHPQDLILSGDDIKAVAARVDVAQLEPPEGFICFHEADGESRGGADDDVDSFEEDDEWADEDYDYSEGADENEL